MMHQLIGSVFALALLAGPVFAADSATSSQNDMPAIQNGDTIGGLRMADKSSIAVRYSAITPADIVATKLLGLKIYNNQNERLGEIEDLVIDNGRTLSGIVVGIGGFLGIGKSYVLIDPASMVVSMRDSQMRANVDTSRDSLKGAPKFSYDKTKRP